MSDDPTIPKVPPRMPDSPRPRKKTAPPRRPPPSRESRFIGYLVLGFGILAVAAVLIIALGQRGGTAPAAVQSAANPQQAAVPPKTATQQAQGIIPPAPQNNESSQSLRARVARDLSNYLNPDPADTARKPGEAPKDLYFRRQPDIKPASIVGAWQTQIGRYTAVLEVNRDSYQLILADPNDYGHRYYSSGTYSNIEDIFVLQPRMTWPPPLSPPGASVNYENITSGKIPVIIALQQGNMLWQNPPRNEERVIVPRSMAILVDGHQDYLVWQRLR